MLLQMLLVCVPEAQYRSAIIGDAAGIALVIAFVTVFAVIGQIILGDEAASDRTQVLLLVIGCGAFFATFTTSILAGLFAGSWYSWLRAAIASVLCCGFFVPAVMLCFAFENRILERNLEPGAIEDGRVSEIIWSILGAMGLFTPTGMRYLYPWPLVAMGIVAVLIFYRWPPARRGQG